jgi:hypothetical protein
MENLLSEPVSGLVKETIGNREIDTMLTSKSLACDLESMIEFGILQDYLDVFGKMEDN